MSWKADNELHTLTVLPSNKKDIVNRPGQRHPLQTYCTLALPTIPNDAASKTAVENRTCFYHRCQPAAITAVYRWNVSIHRKNVMTPIISWTHPKEAHETTDPIHPTHISLPYPFFHYRALPHSSNQNMGGSFHAEMRAVPHAITNSIMDQHTIILFFGERRLHPPRSHHTTGLGAIPYRDTMSRKKRKKTLTWQQHSH